MARTVYVPEAGGALNFSDGTTDQQIIDYVRTKYAPTPVKAPEQAGIGALEAGLYGFRSRSQAAFGKAAQAVGLEGAAKSLFEQSRANEELASTYKPDVANVSDIKSAGDVAKFAGSTLGQSATESGVGLAGAYAGGAAGASIGTAVFPGPGTVVGGIVGGVIGGAIASLPGFVGGNLQRQVQERGTTLEEASGYNASVGAIAQAPLDAAVDALIARKLPGGGAALDIARKGFFKEVAKAAAEGALANTLSEPAQQAIEIAQANPEKLLEFGPDVQNELLNAAAGGMIAGGVIGGAAGGVGTIGRPTKTQLTQKDLAKGYVEAGTRGEQMKKFAEINTGVSSLASQNVIGRLGLGKVRIDPTPANGLKAPIERYQIVDTKGNRIAEFSDPVNAADAVSLYNKMSGKKLTLQNFNNNIEVPVSKVEVKQKAKAPVAPKIEAPIAEAQKPSGPEITAINPFGEGLREAKIFKTSLGSQYAIHPDGSTTRFKTPHPGHDPNDVGLKPKSQRTFYIRSEDAANLSLVQAQGLRGTPIIDQYKPDMVGIRILEGGPEDTKFVNGTLTKIFDQPEVGLTPVEIWNNGAGHHFGNKITEIIDPPISEPTPAAAVFDETPIGGIAAIQDASPDVAADVIKAADETPQPIKKLAEQLPDEPIVTAEDQERVRKLIQDRKDKVATGVREALARYNLKDVQTKFVPAFLDAMGRPVATEGTEVLSENKSIVKLATDIYDPSLTVEDMINRVIEVLNHESIHSLFDLGLIRPAEKAVLINAVSSTKVPGKLYTYLDMAKRVYDPSKPGLEAYTNPDMVAEEAVAEMFRDWRKTGKGAPPNTRGLFNRIIDSLRHMFNVMKRNRYEDIFADIESGKVGARERAPVEGETTKVSIAPELPKLSTAPVYPYGQNVPEVNARQINDTLDHITYGAAVDMLERVFNSKTASSIIPDRFRPSKAGLTNFMQKFADRMLPVGQMIDFIKENGGTVPDAFDAYMAEELMHGKVDDSLKSREVEMYTPLMEYINNSGLSLAEVEDYLYARHAKERNARMREINPGADPAIGSGMSDEEADAILAAVANSPKNREFLNAEQMFRAMIEDTNRLRVEAGLTPDFGNLVDEDGNPVDVPKYEFYAPLRGFADESAVDGEIQDELRARIGRGFKIRGREDMRAFGRKSKATDLIAHAMLQNTESVIRAAKNRVGQSFLSLVESNPELSEQFGVEVMTKGKKPLKKYISSKGVVKTMVDPMYKNSDDVMVVKRNGEEIPIRIDNPFLQKALLAKKSGSPDIAEKAVNTLQKVNRFLAAVNTAYNPEFMLVNFPRDLQTAMVNITQYEIDGIQKKVLKDALPAVKGVYQMLRNPEAVNEWTDWYNMFRQDGGKTSGFFGTFTLDERLKKLEKISQDVSGQPTHRLKEAFDGIKGWLEDSNAAFENAVRLSVYKNLVEAGLSRQRAAQAAKNLTVNFDKRGEYGPILNSLYLFYNASVQGTLSMMMAASRSKKVRKVIGGIVIAGLMQDMINSLMSDKDEDGKNIYDKIADYKLQTNMIIMDPFGLTKNGYYAIPLPYGFNAFYNMGRTMSRTARGEYTSSKAATSMLSTFVDAFNPIGGTESFLNFISPTVLDPVVALSINQDFTGRKIYPEPFPGSIPKADSQMYWSSTSPLFKNTADFLNWATGGTEYVPGMIDISPDVMEYMFDYALGGVGAFGRRLYDTSTSTIPAALTGDLQEIELNNIPLFRKLYGNVSTRVSMEDYFDKVNHVLTRGEELKSAIKEGNPERIKSVRARFFDEIAIYPAIKNLANRRNKLAGELRKIRENTKMPPEQKRRRQDVLQKQIETITNRVNKLYEDKIGNKYPSLFS